MSKPYAKIRKPIKPFTMLPIGSCEFTFDPQESGVDWMFQNLPNIVLEVNGERIEGEWRIAKTSENADETFSVTLERVKR